MFLCCIDNFSCFKKIFNEIEKLIKDDGELIIIDYHPRGHQDFSTHILTHTFPENFNYFDSPQKFSVKLRNKNNDFLLFSDYHWTLTDYLTAVKQGGFIITNIFEPKPDKNILISFDK